MSSNIRITGDNPSPELLVQYPNWENALDEEGVEDQDETTLQPTEDQSVIGEYVSFTAGTAWLNDGRECPAMIEMVDGASGIQFLLDKRWFRLVRRLGRFETFERWETYIEDWLPEDQQFSPAFSLSDEALFPLQFSSQLPFHKTSLPIKLRILPNGGEEEWS